MKSTGLVIEDEFEKNIILKLQNITKLYPGTVALNNINLNISKGEVHGLIGKNGSGKSTLVNIISGVLKPTYGDILIWGKHFKSLSRIQAKKEGISIVTQETPVVPELSIAETFFSPNYTYKNLRLIDWNKIFSEAKKVIEKADFDIDIKLKMGDLSISSRQLLLILKAFYVEETSIIILDEASASLSGRDKKRLYNLIDINRQKGKTILFISHIMDEILKVSDRVSVLRDSKIIATEKKSNLNEKKLTSYIVGKKAYYSFKNKEDRYGHDNEGKEVILSVENLNKIGSFKNINFKIKRGEIVGLAGLRGSGRTEILKAIAGIDPADSGNVRLMNEIKNYEKPSEAIADGVIYLPEERDEEGLVLDMTVGDNLVISSLKNLMSGIFINLKKKKIVVNDLIKLLEITTTSDLQEVKHLSGGNRQKVVFGKIIATRPKVFLLDEPTKGIDVPTKQNILKLIKEKLGKNTSILMSSPGLEEIIKICDRIIVLYQGQIIRVFNKDEFDEEVIYLSIQKENNSVKK